VFGNVSDVEDILNMLLGRRNKCLL